MSTLLLLLTHIQHVRTVLTSYCMQALYIESLSSMHDAVAAVRGKDNGDEHEPEAVVSLLADGLYLFCGMQYGNVHLWNLAGVSTTATATTSAIRAATASDNDASGSSSSSAAGCARGVGLRGALYMGLIRAHILDMPVAAMCMTPDSAGECSLRCLRNHIINTVLLLNTTVSYCVLLRQRLRQTVTPLTLCSTTLTSLFLLW
jgi:hypothetical protein